MCVVTGKQQQRLEKGRRRFEDVTPGRLLKGPGWQLLPLPKPVSNSRLPTLQSIFSLRSHPTKIPTTPSMNPVQRNVSGGPSSTRPRVLEHEGSTPRWAELPWPVSSVLWQALPPRHSALCHSRLENAQRLQRRNCCAPQQGNKRSFYTLETAFSHPFDFMG